MLIHTVITIFGWLWADPERLIKPYLGQLVSQAHFYQLLSNSFLSSSTQVSQHKLHSKGIYLTCTTKNLKIWSEAQPSAPTCRKRGCTIWYEITFSWKTINFEYHFKTFSNINCQQLQRPSLWTCSMIKMCGLKIIMTKTTSCPGLPTGYFQGRRCSLVLGQVLW